MILKITITIDSGLADVPEITPNSIVSALLHTNYNPEALNPHYHNHHENLRRIRDWLRRGKITVEEVNGTEICSKS